MTGGAAAALELNVRQKKYVERNAGGAAAQYPIPDYSRAIRQRAILTRIGCCRVKQRWLNCRFSILSAMMSTRL
jgi:hypothetical protein